VALTQFAEQVRMVAHPAPVWQVILVNRRSADLSVSATAIVLVIELVLIRNAEILVQGLVDQGLSAGF